MSAAAVVIARRRRRLIREFQAAGAVDPLHATTPEALGIRRSWIFDQMVRRGVFLPAPNGQFYLDEAAGAAFLRRQRVRTLVGTAILLMLFLFVWAAGLLGR